MSELSISDPRHGTANGYNNLDCRCDACKKAWADYVAQQRLNRSRKARAGEGGLVHGKSATYSNWRCRCDQCTEAHRIASARRARRARAREKFKITA